MNSNLYAKESILSTVSYIASSDHVYSSSNTGAVNGSDDRLWALKPDRLW